MLQAMNEPLMEEIENIEGDLWIVGNRTLLSLNLSSSPKNFFLSFNLNMNA